MGKIIIHQTHYTTVDFRSFTLSNSGSFTAPSGTMTVGTNFTISGGTFSGNGGTITFDTTAATSIDCGSATLAGVIVNNASKTWTMTANCTVGAFTLTAGTVANPAAARTLSVTGDFAQNANTTFGGANLTVEFSGSSAQNISKTTGTFSSILTVNKTGSNAAALTTALTVTGQTCTIVEGIFDLNGQAFTCSTGFTVQDGGTLELFGSETPTAPTLNTGSTVKYTGDGDSLVDAYIIKDYTYHHLTIASVDSGDTFATPNTTEDANGNFTLSGGTFTAPTTFTIGGNWSKTGGTFTPGSNTVTLDGTSQTISGSTTFSSFTKTVSSADTLTFPASTTQTFTGTMTLKGASDQLLSLRSSSTGTQWKLDPQGTRTIEFLDVKDSNNINSTAIDCIGLNCTDSDNNTGWTFVAPVVSTGSGGGTSGSAEAGTRWLQEQGFLPPESAPKPDFFIPEVGLQPPPSIVQEPTPLPPPPTPEPPGIIERIIPPFLRPPAPRAEPEPIPSEEPVPQEAPFVFQGQWELLPREPVREFVLAPLPTEIRQLSQKFPELGETFEQVGIAKITDLQKLRAIPLSLPWLTETAGVPRRLPQIQWSEEDKAAVPCDIVFAQAGGRLIDFSIVLSVNSQGQPQKQIRTIAGKPLELTVKPCEPGETLNGYLVFKSRTSRTDSLEFPANSLLASVMAARPVFAQVQERPVRVEEALVLLEFAYTDSDGDGIYTAEITAPVVDGEYEIITVMNFEDPELGAKEIRLITVVDPEGYVYRKTGEEKTRILGAAVSLFWLNPQTNQYELWPAKDYQQENPQVTDDTGKYSFLVPEGSYYLTVEAPGYPMYQSDVFSVKEGSGIHQNIELKTKLWRLGIIGWERAVLILVVLLLFYNFWRDKMRKQQG